MASTAITGLVGEPRVLSTRAVARTDALVWVKASAVAFVAALGVFVHLWYLFHLSLNSDQAVAGLMARQMLHGHFTAFYWGQVYGGSAEEAVVAILGAIFGFSAISVNGSMMLFYAVAAVLTWRAARRLVADPWIAGMAGAVAWALPLAGDSNGTYAYGFRGLTLVCGVGAILVALRMLDGHRGMLAFATLGFLIGLGWWSSPEMVYFLVPVAILVAQLLWRGRGASISAWAWRALAAIGAFGVADLPWIWANAGSGFASLSASKFGNASGSTGLHAVSGRLHLYPRYVLPMTFGLRQQYSGAWLGGRDVGIAVYVLAAAVLVGALLVCFAARGRPLAIVAGVVAFPFLLAVSPASQSWQSGRYFIFDIPLVALVLAIAAERVAPYLFGLRSRAHASTVRGRGGLLVITAAALLLCATTAVDFHDFANANRGMKTKWWSSPDDPSLASMHALEASGVTVGYADYWVAYRLDLLSNQKLQLTVGGTDPVRSPSINRAVRGARTAAWVFVFPNRLALFQFGATGLIAGPDGIGESTLVAALARAHISYRSIHAGLIDAVIPSRQVYPEEIAAGQ